MLFKGFKRAFISVWAGILLCLGSVHVQASVLDLGSDAPIAGSVRGEWSFKGACALRTVRVQGSDPVTGSPWEVQGQEWVPSRASVRIDRAVVIVPPTGGVTFLDRSWAKRFCLGHARTFLLEHWTGDLETGIDPSVHDRGSMRGIAAIRQVVSYLRMPKVSVLGSSLGAILASMATGIDARIDRAFLVVAGGSVTDLMTESDQELLVKMRADRMAAYGLKTPEEYRAFLAKFLKIEPTRFAAPGTGKSVTFLIGTKDTTVPTHTQLALWEAWGSPGRVDVPHGHVLSIVAAWAFHGAEVIERLLR